MMRIMMVCGLAAVMLTPAIADDKLAERVAQFFERFDADKDGVVTPEEYTDTELFKRLDQDGDGKITRSDFSVGEQPQPAQSEAAAADVLFKTFDADKNGVISSEEMASAKQLFHQLDANADGQLDANEVARATSEQAAVASKLAAEQPEPKSQGRTETPMQGDVQDPRMKMMLARFDKDQDGKVSQEEWITAHQELFGQMDKNGDGTLSTDELAAAPMMRGQGGGEGPAMSGELLKGIMTRFDKDGDGALSKEEAPERMAALFDRLDTNGDGKLTAEELTAAGGRPGLQRKLPGGDAPQGAPGEGGLEGFKRLRQMDKNGDGEFTADEIPAELMQRLDKNGDGKVTKDELQGLRR